MVQLVTDGGTKYYKVMLVCGDDLRFNTYAAHSKTGAWSWMESGPIFGDGHRSFVHNEVNDRRVFDCTTKTMYQFVSRGPGQPINRLRTTDTSYRLVNRFPHPYSSRRLGEGVNARHCTMSRGRLFALHECSEDPQVRRYSLAPSHQNGQTNNRGSQVSGLQSDLSSLYVIERSHPEILPSNSNICVLRAGVLFFLLVENGDVSTHQRQLVRVYGTSANNWHVLSNIRYQDLDKYQVLKLKDIFFGVSCDGMLFRTQIIRYPSY